MLSRSMPRAGVRGTSGTIKSPLHAVHHPAIRDNAIIIVKRRGFLLIVSFPDVSCAEKLVERYGTTKRALPPVEDVYVTPHTI